MKICEMQLEKCLERNFRDGNGIPLQYSCLENPMDGGSWWAAVHGVAKTQARLSDFTLSVRLPSSPKLPSSQAATWH